MWQRRRRQRCGCRCTVRRAMWNSNNSAATESMNDTLALIAVLAVGAASGWWLEGRTPATRKLVFRITLIVLGVPLALLLFASVVGSNTLGAIGGFSLMALVALAVPLGLGVLLG